MSEDYMEVTNFKFPQYCTLLVTFIKTSVQEDASKSREIKYCQFLLHLPSGDSPRKYLNRVYKPDRTMYTLETL